MPIILRYDGGNSEEIVVSQQLSWVVRDRGDPAGRQTHHMPLATNMRRLLVVILIIVCAAVVGHAGDTTETTPINPTVELGTIGLGGLIGVESAFNGSWGGRFYLGVPVGHYVYASLMSTAATRASRDSPIRVSANSLFTAVSLFGIYTRSLLILAIVPQAVLNPTIDVPIIEGGTIGLSAIASLRTDWFAFSDGSKVYMEASPGLRIRIGKAVVEGRYVWPFVKGYLESSDPILGIDLYYGGTR